MRFQVIAHALVATATASTLPRATSSADLNCLEDISELAQNVPLPPSELAVEFAATPTCLPPSLNSIASRYKSEASSWLSGLEAEISNCPSYPSKAPTMPELPAFATCTGGTAATAATGMTTATTQATGTATATGRGQTTGTSSGTSSSPSGSATPGANSTPSSSKNMAARETGAALVAAVAVIAAAAAL